MNSVIPHTPNIKLPYTWNATRFFYNFHFWTVSRCIRSVVGLWRRAPDLTVQTVTLCRNNCVATQVLESARDGVLLLLVSYVISLANYILCKYRVSHTPTLSIRLCTFVNQVCGL